MGFLSEFGAGVGFLFKAAFVLFLLLKTQYKIHKMTGINKIGEIITKATITTRHKGKSKNNISGRITKRKLSVVRPDNPR